MRADMFGVAKVKQLAPRLINSQSARRHLLIGYLEPRETTVSFAPRGSWWTRARRPEQSPEGDGPLKTGSRPVGQSQTSQTSPA